MKATLSQNSGQLDIQGDADSASALDESQLEIWAEPNLRLILDILSGSGDICEQSRKLCKIDPNFACFWPPNFLGEGSPNFWTWII